MDTDLLPADPDRGVTDVAVDEAEGTFDGIDYAYGMHTAAGAARLGQLVDQVRAVVAAGLGRDVALHTWFGGAVRLERDGHGEYSDTVVRESVAAVLADAFEEAGLEPLTDAELQETALLLSLRCIEASTSTLRRSLSA